MCQAVAGLSFLVWWLLRPALFSGLPCFFTFHSFGRPRSNVRLQLLLGEPGRWRAHSLIISRILGMVAVHLACRPTKGRQA